MKVVEKFRPTVTQPQRRFIALNPLPSVSNRSLLRQIRYVLCIFGLGCLHTPLPTSLQTPVVQMYHVLNDQIHYSWYIVV
jgi:hypothetical protein